MSLSTYRKWGGRLLAGLAYGLVVGAVAVLAHAPPHPVVPIVVGVSAGFGYLMGAMHHG